MYFSIQRERGSFKSTLVRRAQFRIKLKFSEGIFLPPPTKSLFGFPPPPCRSKFQIRLQCGYSRSLICTDEIKGMSGRVSKLFLHFLKK